MLTRPRLLGLALIHPGLLLTLDAAELMEELVVTASSELKIEQNRKISALNSDLTLTGGGGLEHLLRFEPNVQSGSAPGSVFSLRGLTQEGTATVGTRSNPSLQVIGGGVPRSTNTLWAFGTPAWDTGGLAITRGPALFGTGPAAQGGELRLEPNAPQFFHQGFFLAEFGDFATYRSGLTENFVILPGKLAARLNIASEGTDEAVTNITLNDDTFASIRRDLLRGQLRWQPAGDDSSVIDFLLETERSRGNPLALATTLPGGDLFDREVAMNTREIMPVDRQAASIRGRVELSDGRWLEGEAAWQQIDGYQIADFDASPALDWFYRVGVEESRLTGGSRLHGEKENLSWTLGLYAESSDYDFSFSGIGFAPIPQGSPYTSSTREDVDAAAVFARGEYEVQPHYWLTTGLRLDHQQRRQSSSALFPGTPPATSRSDVSSTEWLPEIGVEWRDADAKVGLKIARAYRPAAAAYALTQGILQEYGAERGWETNLHAENRWDRLQLAGRLFYARLDNLQVPFVSPGGFPILDELITNSGQGTRAGAEIELQWQGPGAFQTSLSGGWLHTRFDELVLNGVDRSGQKFPSSPEFTSAIQLAWSPATGWFGESALTWSDTSYTEPASPQNTALEKRLLLAARTGYRWQNAELYLFGTNLLDEDFAIVRRDFSGIGRATDGRPNTPRLLGAGLSVHW